MKQSPLSSRLCVQSLPVLAAVTLALGSRQLLATSDTWNGADGTWGTGTNWLANPAVVPGTGDTATFSGTGVTAVTAGTINLGNLTFDATAQPYNITGSITLDANGIISAASGAAAQTVNLVSLAGSGTVLSDSVNPLSINIQSPVAGSTLTFGGAGAITTLGSLAAAGNTTAVVKNGPGTLTLGNFSNTNIQGGFTINGGTAIALNANSFSNRNLTIGGGTTIQMNASGAQSSYGNTAGTGVTVNGDTVLNYNVSASQWRIGATNGNGFLNSSNQPVVTITTAGGTGNVQTYLNTSAFDGTIKLGNEGVFALNHINAAGGANFRVNMGEAASTGRHIFQTGVILHVEGATQNIVPVRLGELRGANTGSLLAGRVNVGTRTTGTQYLVGGLGTSTTYAGGISDGVTAAGVAQSNGNADATSGATTYGRNNGAAGVQGTTEFIKTGAGTLTLTGASTHTGGTVIQSGTLAVNSDAALGAAYDGTLRVFSYIPGTGVYSNTDLPDAVLTGGGGSGASVNVFSSTFANNANNNLFLSFSAQANDSTSGAIVNDATGSGYTSVPAVSFTGGTQTTAGTAPVASVRVKGLLTLDGGTLRTDAAITSNRAVVVGAAGGVLDTNGFDSVFSGNINGTGNLSKTGSGTLTLSGSSSLTGVVTVSQGVLNLEGSLAGAVTVNAGADLTGDGSASGGAVVLGEISPGNSIGELSFGGPVSLGGIATIELDAAGGPNADLIDVAGSVSLGGDLNVSFLGSPGAGIYNIIDATAFSGTFASVNLPALPTGLTWDTSLLNTQGILTVIPEPGTAALGLIGVSLLTGRRRRRD